MQRRDEVNHIVCDEMIKANYQFSVGALYNVADLCSETLMKRVVDFLKENAKNYVYIDVQTGEESDAIEAFINEDDLIKDLRIAVNK